MSREKRRTKYELHVDVEADHPSAFMENIARIFWTAAKCLQEDDAAKTMLSEQGFIDFISMMDQDIWGSARLRINDVEVEAIAPNDGELIH